MTVAFSGYLHLNFGILCVYLAICIGETSFVTFFIIIFCCSVHKAHIKTGSILEGKNSL